MAHDIQAERAESDRRNPPDCPQCGEMTRWYAADVQTSGAPAGYYCFKGGCPRYEVVESTEPPARPRCAAGADCTHPDCAGHEPPASAEPTPRNAAPADRDEERKARILDAVHASAPVVPYDCDIAETVGVLDRDALRADLAALVIDGKLLVEERQPSVMGWIDGAAPWLVRLAPAGTPTLEDRIVSALAGAGVKGLSDVDLDAAVSEALGPMLDLLPHDLADGFWLEDPTKALAARGVIQTDDGSSWYWLGADEWARRLYAEVEAAHVEVPIGTALVLRKRFAEVLAGERSEPAAPTLRADEEA